MRTPHTLFHGTNIVAATKILLAGRFNADTPVDGEEPVVCTTGSYRVARCFAVEFVRVNSSMDIGVVFRLDGKAIADELEINACDAETASFDEKEFRVHGDIDIRHVVDVRCVGKTHLLRSERYLERLWDEHARGIAFVDFANLIDRLKDRPHQGWGANSVAARRMRP